MERCHAPADGGQPDMSEVDGQGREPQDKAIDPDLDLEGSKNSLVLIMPL